MFSSQPTDRCHKCWPKTGSNHMAWPLYLRTMDRAIIEFRGLGANLRANQFPKNLVYKAICPSIPKRSKGPCRIFLHSVLERIWVSYLSQWLPHGEITMNWNLPQWVPLTNFFFKVFFRLKFFIFRNKKNFSKEQLLFSFLYIVKQKKNSEWSENFWKFLIFQNH